MTTTDRPSVLFVYFTYTGQTQKLVDTMAEVLESRGCDVTKAAIEFTDPRYEKRFQHFPMKRPFLEVVAMIPAELRRRPATIGIPAAVSEGTYDFVIVGAPTWWLSTDVDDDHRHQKDRCHAPAIPLQGQSLEVISRHRAHLGRDGLDDSEQRGNEKCHPGQLIRGGRSDGGSRAHVGRVVV